jgi:hypothetical protein
MSGQIYGQEETHKLKHQLHHDMPLLCGATCRKHCSFAHVLVFNASHFYNQLDKTTICCNQIPQIFMYVWPSFFGVRDIRVGSF